MIYTAIKKIYRTLATPSLKNYVQSGQSWPAQLIRSAKSRMETAASHDQVYDHFYFEGIDHEMRRSAPAIAQSLIDHFQPAAVLDVGCGTGSILLELQIRGCQTFGLEYAQAALDICARKGVNARKFDLEAETETPGVFDLALSTEVAEHLPERCADRFCDLLAGASRQWIVLTAAVPGQGGTDHVNEQPNDYWIDRIQARKFVHLPELTHQIRTEWADNHVDAARASNVMVFRAQ